MPDKDGNALAPGDLVEWAGSGWCSALIGGPGVVEEVTSRLDSDGDGSTHYAKVRVLTPGECLGNRFEKDETFSFRQSSLRKVPQ